MLNKTVLPNGAKILTETVDEVYSASMGIWVDVGSQDENEKDNGVSHCLEHMLFKGTAKRSAAEIAQEIEDVGGSLGAATSKENTCYYARIMGDQLPVAIDLLVDMLKNARIDSQDLDLEREVILEEIRMYEDDPEDLCQEILLFNIWQSHPLGRPITGTAASVAGINSEMLKNHVNNFYRPKNMIVSIAGKFDEKAAIDTLARELGAIKSGLPKKSLPDPTLYPCKIIKDKDIEQAHVAIATEGMGVIDDRRYQLAILDLGLGGNMSSRLFQEVREKRGLVYTINTYKASHSHCGLFGVYAGTGPGKVKSVLELVMEEFRRVKAEGLTEREINRAKAQLKSDLLLGLESMRNRASRNAYGELFFGKQLEVEEICRDIEKVTASEVKQLANDLLKTEKLSLVVVGPGSQLQDDYELSC